MQSKSMLVLANRQCTGLVFPLLDDLQSAALVSPISGSGNHAHWLLGHLVFYEGRYREMMQGILNPCHSLQDKFGGGSQPDPAAADYPQYEELLSRLRSLDEECGQQFLVVQKQHLVACQFVLLQFLLFVLLCPRPDKSG